MKPSSFPDLDPTAAKNVDLWLQGDYDAPTKQEIRRLLKENPKELTDAFYTHLSFGTGGLRAIMGVGCNRMNTYTVKYITQGLANYINKQTRPASGHSVFIGFDSRHHSLTFATEAAKVLAGNGIRVFLFKELRPSPLVSYGCRYKKCSAAVMITASHNPPEYNGYKVFWSDGGQVLPPHDHLILKEIEKITDGITVKCVSDLKHELIEIVDEEIDQAYLKDTASLQLYHDQNQRHGKELKVVYTSLHGTGITMVPRELAAWGFSSLITIDKQTAPDGDFPTVNSPNPEEESALALGIAALEKNEADLLIATDPDADRVGVAVRHHGETCLLNGNQIASICLNHICEALKKQGRMPAKGAFIKTIGTTELFQKICDAYGKPCINVLTGFKYFAEKIHEWEDCPAGNEFIFGGEESFGYLLGSFTRDKDGVSSSALICETALHGKLQGKTLVDLLHELYQKYGAFYEELLSVKFDESKEGREKMFLGMSKLREKAFATIADIEIAAIEDYQSLQKIFLKSGKTEPLMLPKSNVLLFWLSDESKIMIRPSGTEPKIKVYCGVVQKKFASVEEALKECQNKANKLLHSIKSLLTVG